ncbi:MAG: conjugal transfer protein [Acidovorax sp. 16-64-162]|nr:MAG: conjugal transfer protein [Acidovorax sp. 16-64-162]
MNGAQVSAFQANSGIAPSAMATVLVGVVFAVLLVWGVWAIRTAYVGWSESRDLKGTTMQNRILHSRLAQRAAVALGAAALPALSFAQGLPQLENPTRGTGNGIMETIRNYGYDIIMLVALLVVASMFIGVCYHAYGTYAEIHTGRKTWGQFGLTVAIGAVLLVIGIWLLTEATGIL